MTAAVIITLVLLAVGIPAGLWLAWWWRQGRVGRLRDQARLKAIEAQMAYMRAAQRIQAAEHVARRHMHAELQDGDRFGGRIRHDESGF